MSDYGPPSTPVCMQVLNILAGHTADGVAPLARPLSFTKELGARRAAASLATHLISHLEMLSPGLTFSEANRTALIYKLLSHLSRSGRQTESSIHAMLDDIDRAVEELINHRRLIASPVNFASILRRAAQTRARLDATADKLKLPPDVPPRPVLWTSPDAVYRLEELTHPCHLLVEGAVLRHCISRDYDERLLASSGLRRGTPAGSACLRYWLRIESGATRILSLANRKTQLVTIELATENSCIHQIARASNRPILGEEPWFHALIEAFVFLSKAHGPLMLCGDIFEVRLLVRALTERATRVIRHTPLRANEPFRLF